MRVWYTQNGEKIPFDKLTDTHLLNILRHIKKMAKEGIGIHRGGMALDEPWYEEEILYGEEVLDRLRYYELKKIAKDRGILPNATN